MSLKQIRITPAIQQAFEDPITDSLARSADGPQDPSDAVYLKVHAAMQARKGVGPVVIAADVEDLRELKSRSEYEVGSQGVCQENIADSTSFVDRAYWLGRQRAYRALLKQLTAA